jgi:hypothetical protein
MAETHRTDLVGLTAEIISAYVSNNTVVAADLPAIIGEVHEALSKAAQRIGTVEREELRPAVALKRSVTPDYIVCLEDGKKFKSLKRHLRTHYNLPDGRAQLCGGALAARQADGARHAPREGNGAPLRVSGGPLRPRRGQQSPRKVCDVPVRSP